MAITVKHSKVSAIPDGDDASVVRPSDWNADHTLTGTVPVTNGGTGASTAADGLNNLLPSQTGNNGKVLATDGTNASWTTNGSGDVVGPASATDNAITRFDGTTGKLIQNSVVTIGDTGAATGFTTLSASTSVTTPIVQASNSGGLALKNSGGTTQMSVGAGGGDNMSINVSTNLNGTNAQIDISPTGTGHVHMNPSGSGSIEIAPTSAGTMNNMVIGGTTPAAGTFTALTSTSGALNGSIGATTPSTGKFTTLEATGTSSLGTTSTTYVTITGDASYPMVKAAGGTNTPLVLSPLGTGALQAQKTDSTATGGNARGANAVDWQTSRSSATSVASGAYSVIGGGYNNSASNSYSIVGGGYGNTVSTTTQYASILGGVGLGAAGFASTAVGGWGNVANGAMNFIGGGYNNSGTAQGAITTQSSTMNGTTAVTLAASNATIKVGQYITGTSIAGGTYVAAISGTALTLSVAASGSSTSTLSFYTPHGVVVGGGNNQATGSYSFIGGGGDAGTAANRNTASGDWSFVGGGIKSIASGANSVVCGGGTTANANTASGQNSFIGGGGLYGANTAGGPGAFIGAGWSNNASGASAVCLGIGGQANADYSSVIGGSYGNARSIQGNTVFSASSAPLGTIYTNQAALLILARETTNATATVLCSSASAASGTNQVILPNNSAYYFTGEVISGVTGGGDTKGWTISGVIKRGANAAATTLVGSTVTSLYADAGAATWTIGLTADTTNGGLKVTFTGQAATTIRTVAKISTVEMTY